MLEHHAPDTLQSRPRKVAPSVFPLNDHLKDVFRNSFVRTDAVVRCIEREAENVFFPDGVLKFR